mmetsp:Transcript_77676/g.206248  ORF Transcript_77676/g.206248 Transcript_77676/m.206248 type:complete len:230 (-) Transcript_77676:438-1127(-)
MAAPSASQPLRIRIVTPVELPPHISSAISSALLQAPLHAMTRCQLSASRSSVDSGAKSARTQPGTARRAGRCGTWRKITLPVPPRRTSTPFGPSRQTRLPSAERGRLTTKSARVLSVMSSSSRSSGSLVYSWMRFMAISWYCADAPTSIEPSTPERMEKTPIRQRLARPTSSTPGTQMTSRARLVTKKPPRTSRRPASQHRSAVPLANLAPMRSFIANWNSASCSSALR